MTDVDETQRAVEAHLTEGHARLAAELTPFFDDGAELPPLRRPAVEMARPERAGDVLLRLAPRSRWRREDADAMRDAMRDSAEQARAEAERPVPRKTGR